MRPVLRFGPFELDPAVGELLQDGSPVRLQPQPFKVLYLLASRAGQTVTREEVRRAVWGEETHVDFDQGLGFCVSQIRAVLGDSAQEPRYVQTLPRRGYRFVAEVETAPSAETAPEPARRRSRRWASLATSALVAAVALTLALRGPTPGAATEQPHLRLAVLPFEDLSGSEMEVPLGDALTEEIISEVGRLNPERLSVIARSSAMQFRGPQADLNRLRDELDVDYALEGSVRIEGEQVRITTRLVRLADVTQVFVEVYDRELGDLLGLQRRVAADTASQLRVALTPDARQRIAATRPVDPEVSHLTLVGGYQLRRRTPESLEQAAALFQQAVELDPSHAPAWAGLAEAAIARGDREIVPRSEAFEMAEDAARRALELDPELASAHALLGGIAAIRDWDWSAARAYYERSLALGPEAVVHRWYSHLLWTLDDPQGAAEHAWRAVQLDPLSVPANRNLVFALILAEDYAGALEQAERAQRIDLEAVDIHLERALALLGLGRHEEALQTIESAAQLETAHKEDAIDCRLARAHVLEALGRRDEARRDLEALLPAAGDEHKAFLRARVLAALGRHEAALDALDTAIAQRHPYARWLAIVREFETLEGSSRYQALRREIGIAARKS